MHHCFRQASRMTNNCFRSRGMDEERSFVSPGSVIRSKNSTRPASNWSGIRNVQGMLRTYPRSATGAPCCREHRHVPGRCPSSCRNTARMRGIGMGEPNRPVRKPINRGRFINFGTRARQVVGPKIVDKKEEDVGTVDPQHPARAQQYSHQEDHFCNKLHAPKTNPERC